MDVEERRAPTDYELTPSLSRFSTIGLSADQPRSCPSFRVTVTGCTLRDAIALHGLWRLASTYTTRSDLPWVNAPLGGLPSSCPPLGLALLLLCLGRGGSVLPGLGK